VFGLVAGQGAVHSRLAYTTLRHSKHSGGGGGSGGGDGTVTGASKSGGTGLYSSPGIGTFGSRRAGGSRYWAGGGGISSSEHVTRSPSSAMAYTPSRERASSAAAPATSSTTPTFSSVYRPHQHQNQHQHQQPKQSPIRGYGYSGPSPLSPTWTDRAVSTAAAAGADHTQAASPGRLDQRHATAAAAIAARRAEVEAAEAAACTFSPATSRGPRSVGHVRPSSAPGLGTRTGLGTGTELGRAVQADPTLTQCSLRLDSALEYIT
jgi:hypothetical protein